MGKIARASACIAVVGALPMAIGIGLPIDRAGAAENCAAAPGVAAPRGQHWYYRVDQVNHRKCWYLHSIVPLAGRAAAEPRAANAEADSQPVTTPSPSAVTPQAADAPSAASETTGIHPAPRVTVLNVKPVNPPSLDAKSAYGTTAPEQTNEMPTASVPPDLDTKPARPVRGPKVQAAANATHDALTAAQNETAAPAQGRSAWLLLPLLALALGIAGLLIAFLRKIADLSRAPLVSEHPDDAWRRYHMSDHQADEAIMHQEHAPFLAPHEPYGAIDLDAPDWLDQLSSAKVDFPPASQYERPRQRERELLTQKDIEQRLRILRHPSRGVVPSGKER